MRWYTKYSNNKIKCLEGQLIELIGILLHKNKKSEKLYGFFCIQIRVLNSIENLTGISIKLFLDFSRTLA